jgi:hypothetical protein
MPDPAALGERVLAILDAGRAAAHERAHLRTLDLQRAILDELHRELLERKPARGRAGRIQRRLKHRIPVSQRHVKRILDMLSSVSDPMG